MRGVNTSSPKCNISSPGMIIFWFLLIFENAKKSAPKTTKWPSLTKAQSTLASAHNSDQRDNIFEFFGADFMLDESLNVILLEINRSPDPSSNTRYQREMFNALGSTYVLILIKN